jgi:hypothetical protein
MGKLILYSPPDLKTSLGNEGEIFASMADFGHIPYGHTIVGQVVHISKNEYGWYSFANTLKDFDDPTPIVIVKRGECSFVQKVRNIEHGGGKLAIIVDEVNSENVKFVTMVNDGTGNGIIIPSVLINKDPGNTIIEFLTSHSAEVTRNVKIVANFSLPNPDNHVEYALLLSTYQDRALDFVSGFKEYRDKLGDKAQMTPYYFSWPCSEWDDDIKAIDCYGNGKYWAVDYYDMNTKGRDILLANIRQKWIYKHSMKTKKNDADWWEYVTKAHASCYTDFTEDCSKRIHEKVGIDYNTTMQCVEESFTNKGTQDEDNSILGEDFEFWVESGFQFTPSVIINDIKYNGDMAPSYVYEAICASFKDKPQECFQNYTLPVQTTITEKSVSFNWFIFVIVILVISNIFLAIFCIRRNKSQLKTHVFSALGKYSKFERGNNI